MVSVIIVLVNYNSSLHGRVPVTMELSKDMNDHCSYLQIFKAVVKFKPAKKTKLEWDSNP